MKYYALISIVLVVGLMIIAKRYEVGDQYIINQDTVTVVGYGLPDTYYLDNGMSVSNVWLYEHKKLEKK